MRTFTRIVSPTDRSSEVTKQPGMNLNCARSPLRLENENTPSPVPLFVSHNPGIDRDASC